MNPRCCFPVWLSGFPAAIHACVSLLFGKTRPIQTVMWDVVDISLPVILLRSGGGAFPDLGRSAVIHGDSFDGFGLVARP